MLDALARVEPVARPLLAQVDRALERLGAPPAHPVWDMLRRVGALPTEAVAAVAAWDPAPLRGAASSLRGYAGVYLDMWTNAPTSWHGRAATAHAAHVGALERHLKVGPDSMAHRLAETAGYADAVADFYERGRTELAEALADTLACAEAVMLRAPTSRAQSRASAAADIAAYLLEVLARTVAAGEHLPDVWRARVSKVDFQPASEPDPAPDIIDVQP